MYQDLHSHTYYSYCGGDMPEQIVEAAIAGGLDVFGITDHNYGVAWQRFDVFVAPDTAKFEAGDGYRTYKRYFDHINLIKEKYRDKIDVKRGIEICTLKDGEAYKIYSLPDAADVSFFDYCLIENLDHPHSMTGGDLFGFRERLGTPIAGIAHTDMFRFIESRGEKPLDYFKRMAAENIFWEMNVSYDSIHNYREHAYVGRFFETPEQIEIVRESGVRVSVGFDGHRVGDYLPDRVKGFCEKLTANGIKMPFEA